MAKQQSAVAVLLAATIITWLGEVAPAGAATSVAPPPKCIEKDSMFNRAKLENGILTLCTIKDVCWQVDLANERWQPSSGPPLEMEQSTDAVEVSKQGFKVCDAAKKSCETVQLPKVDNDDSGATTAVVNEDRSLIAVVPGHKAARVFDLKTKKQLYTVKPTKSAMSFIARVRFVGPALYVMSSYSPVSSSGRLVNARTGKLLAHIGGKVGEVDEHMPLALGEDRYAFATWMLDKLLIVNVKNGKVLKKVALGGDPKLPQEGLTLLTLSKDGKIVAVGATTAIALVQLIDPATGARTVLKAPKC